MKPWTFTSVLSRALISGVYCGTMRPFFAFTVVALPSKLQETTPGISVKGAKNEGGCSTAPAMAKVLAEADKRAQADKTMIFNMGSPLVGSGQGGGDIGAVGARGGQGGGQQPHHHGDQWQPGFAIDDAPG